MLGLLAISILSNMNIDKKKSVDLLKVPQDLISGRHLINSLSYDIKLSHKSLALTESAYECYISGVGWSTNGV